MIDSYPVRVKVFVEGLDVSDFYSGGSVNFRLNDIGSATVNLESPNMEFVIEEDDLEIIKRIRSGHTAENPFGNSDRKYFKNKLLPRLLNQKVSYLGEDYYLYEFGIYGSIFPYLSNVRIFVEFNGVWYLIFSGLVTGKSLSMGLDDSFGLTLHCSDVLLLLRRSLLSTSLAIFEPTGVKNFLKDMFKGKTEQIQSYFSAGLWYSTKVDFSLYKFGIKGDFISVMKKIIYGDVGNAKDNDYGDSVSYKVDFPLKDRNLFPTRRNRYAPGLFKLSSMEVGIVNDEGFSSKLKTDAPVKVYGISDWYSKISSLKIVPEDLINLAVVEDRELVENLFPNYGEYDQETIINLIGVGTRMNGLYNVSGAGGLKILLPGSLETSAYDAMSPERFVNPELESYGFNSRLQALSYILTKRTDFVYYATPKGDIVIEFPFYDVDNFIGSFDKRHRTGDFTDSEDVRDLSSIATCSPQMGATEIESEGGQKVLVPITPNIQGVYSPSLIAKYGVKIIRADSYFGWVPMNEESAKSKAEIVLSIENRKKYSASVSLGFFPVLFLNRQVEFIDIGRAGMVEGLSFSNLSTGSTPNTTLNLIYLRQWNGEGYKVAFNEKLETLSIDYGKFFDEGQRAEEQVSKDKKEIIKKKKKKFGGFGGGKFGGKGAGGSWEEWEGPIDPEVL